MSFPNDQFVPIPGELPAGYCFTSWQRLNVDIISRMQIQQRDEIGTTFWNVSATVPPPDKRIYPWLNLQDGRVYIWSIQYGKWISPRPFSFGQVLPPELNYTEAQIWALDGGDGTDPRLTVLDNTGAQITNIDYKAPSPVTGAMWQVAHSMDGRFLLGAGKIPYTDPLNPLATVTVTFGANIDSAGVAGAYNHLLTQLEGGIGGHTHKYGVKDPTASAAAFSTGSLQTVASYSARYIGGNSPTNLTETTADLETLAPLDTSGNPLTATGSAPTLKPFPIMPPFAAGWFIIPTVRQWYAIPG